MLAKPGQPFDDAAYLFEIKWDGTRCLAFIDRDGYRLVNRRQFDMTERYPEFAFLSQLPPGTVLDGEVVVLRSGKPDFALLESREHTRAAFRIKTLSRTTPATYVVFDVMYANGEPLMSLPLSERRERLRKLVADVNQHQLVLSEGVVGQGKAFFREVTGQGLEGVVAKRLASAYLPGKRTDAWIKVKRFEHVLCAIIGFLPEGKDDFRSLILATDVDGDLRYAGKVGTGFNAAMRRRLNALLWSRLRAKPLVPTKIKGRWVEPGLYCRVSCMERTPGGDFRAPVFEELITE
jgi:DNA ligase D-like protein (predicted ligase)